MKHSFPIARRWQVMAWSALLLALGPAVLFFSAVSDPWPDLMGRVWTDPGLLGSLQRSAVLLGSTAVLSLAAGWPLGTLVGVAGPTIRRLGWAVFAPAILCPAFLWAVAVQGWKGLVPYALQSWFDGRSGLILAAGCQGALLTAFLTSALAGWSSRSQREACLLFQGSRLLFAIGLRLTLGPAVAASLVATAVIGSDAGAPQLMGYHTFASEIHIALAAGQLERASVRMVAAAVLYLPLGAGAAWFLVRCLTGQIAVATSRSDAGREAGGTPRLSVLWILPVMLILPGAILTGLCLPLARSAGAAAQWRDALTVLADSGGPTVTFAGVAALACLLLALPLGWAGMHSAALLRGCIIIQLLLLCCPPQLHGAGMLHLRNSLGGPGWPDAFQAIWVGLASALRQLPLYGLIVALWLRAMPRSWLESAALAGTPLLQAARLIVLPVLWRPLMLLALAAGMLALADVAGALLLQPPGLASYPMRLFALMDNAPAAQVSALCLVYWLAPLLAAVVSMCVDGVAAGCVRLRARLVERSAIPAAKGLV